MEDTNNGYESNFNDWPPPRTQTRTVVRGDLTIWEDDTVVENLDIYGDLKIRAERVVLHNVKVRGHE